MYGSIDRVIARTRGDKEDFGFETDQEFSDFIGEWLEQASDEIDRFTGRDFEQHTEESEVLYGNGRSIMSVSNIPVIDIDSIETEGGKTVDPDSYELRPTPSSAKLNTGRIRRTNRRRWVRNRGYTINYSWGFEETPPGVAGIAEEMVVNLINADTAEIAGGAVASESMDGYSVQYDLMDMSGKLTLTENMKERLKPYQNMSWG